MTAEHADDPEDLGRAAAKVGIGCLASLAYGVITAAQIALLVVAVALGAFVLLLVFA